MPAMSETTGPRLTTKFTAFPRGCGGRASHGNMTAIPQPGAAMRTIGPIGTISAAVLCSVLATPALAQSGKTLRLVSGVTPGSASDTVARILTDKLQAQLGQSVIVENRLGAGGVIAAAYV